MEIPKHFACAVIWRIQKGKKELLVQDVISTYEGKRGKQQTKFIGGMQRLPEDSIEVTLTREIVEESYLRYSGSLNEIWAGVVYDRNHPEKVHHTKHGFLVPFVECTGELRSEPIDDSNDYMFPPEWLPADEVGRRLYSSHQPILLAALHHLSFM